MLKTSIRGRGYKSKIPLDNDLYEQWFPSKVPLNAGLFEALISFSLEFLVKLHYIEGWAASNSFFKFGRVPTKIMNKEVLVSICSLKKTLLRVLVYECLVICVNWFSHLFFRWSLELRPSVWRWRLTSRFSSRPWNGWKNFVHSSLSKFERKILLSI